MTNLMKFNAADRIVTGKHKKEGVENPLFLYGYYTMKTYKSFIV